MILLERGTAVAHRGARTFGSAHEHDADLEVRGRMTMSATAVARSQP